MKKVLILSNHFATIYKFRRELVEKLVEKGYEVVVSLPKGDDNKEIEALGVRIIETYVDRKSLNPIKDIKLFLDYLKIIKKEKPDIAIGYTIKPNIGNKNSQNAIYRQCNWAWECLLQRWNVEKNRQHTL